MSSEPTGPQRLPVAQGRPLALNPADAPAVDVYGLGFGNQHSATVHAVPDPGPSDLPVREAVEPIADRFDEPTHCRDA